MISKDPTYEEDRLLLEQLRQDDETAFTTVFHKYWEKLYAVAFNRLQSKQAAEEIVQDVLTSLWLRRKDANIVCLRHYLAVATKYCVFRQLKKTLKQQSFSYLLSGENSLESEKMLDAKFLHDQLAKEMAQLPEKCRLVFKYSRELGFSNREIANEMNVSVKMVEAHITRALKQLRAHMKSMLFLFF